MEFAKILLFSIISRHGYGSQIGMEPNLLDPNLGFDVIYSTCYVNKHMFRCYHVWHFSRWIGFHQLIFAHVFEPTILKP